MRYLRTVLIAALVTVAFVAGCSTQTPASIPQTSPSESASVELEGVRTERQAVAAERCQSASETVAELLTSDVVKRDHRSLGDGLEACWWQTRYSGYLAVVRGPAPLDFVAILDDVYDEPTAWQRDSDSPMWATGQGFGAQASWTSKDKSVQAGVIARGIDGDSLMDLMSLAAEIAQA